MQVKTLVLIAFVCAASVGALDFLYLCAAIGFMMSTGGLYGGGDLSDATALSLLVGSLILLTGCVPIVLIILRTMSWRKSRAPAKSVSFVSWLFAIGGLLLIGLDILTTVRSQRSFSIYDLGLGSATPIFVIALLGFLGFLIGTRKSNPS